MTVSKTAIRTFIGELKICEYTGGSTIIGNNINGKSALSLCRLTWYAALEACQSYPNGNLASIHNFADRFLLNGLALNNFHSSSSLPNAAWFGGCWIGLHRKDFVIMI